MGKPYRIIFTLSDGERSYDQAVDMFVRDEIGDGEGFTMAAVKPIAVRVSRNGSTVMHGEVKWAGGDVVVLVCPCCGQHDEGHDCAKVPIRGVG